MKVLRWQEASLESSKGFYRGSRSYLKYLKASIPRNTWKSIKNHKNLWKSMKTCIKRWMSSDDKKPAPGSCLKALVSRLVAQVSFFMPKENVSRLASNTPSRLHHCTCSTRDLGQSLPLDNKNSDQQSWPSKPPIQFWSYLVEPGRIRMKR